MCEQFRIHTTIRDDDYRVSPLCLTSIIYLVKTIFFIY